MDIGKSIGFVFEDKEWVTKVLIGGVVSLIPVANLAALGYALRTLQNVAAGKGRPLPEWSDFGEHLVQGLLVFIAVLIYLIPLLVVGGMSFILSRLGDARAVGDVLRLCTWMLACVQFLLALIVGFWTPAASMNFATSGEFGAFFRVGQIWELISRSLGDYIAALLVSAVVAVVAGFVGIVLCVIGLAFTGFVASLIYSHLLGQVLAKSRQPAPAGAA